MSTGSRSVQQKDDDAKVKQECMSKQRGYMGCYPTLFWGEFSVRVRARRNIYGEGRCNHPCWL